MESPISTPEDLVNEWKRSGGLDLARKSILNEFMSSVRVSSFSFPSSPFFLLIPNYNEIIVRKINFTNPIR